MLKGFFTLLLIFAVGLLLMSFAMPEQFQEVSNFAHTQYQTVSGIFTKNNTSSLDQEQLLPENNGENIPTESSGPVSSNGVLNIADIIDATNKERIINNLPPLRINDKLQISSKLKTEDMVALQYFEHESPSGESVSDLGRKVGYDYIVMGENLALGNFSSASELLAAWMASPGHRANILNAKYQEIGIYAVEANYQGRKVWFAVQHFGTQKSVCPSISTTLKNDIAVINDRLSGLEEKIQKKKAELEEPQAKYESDYKQQIDDFNVLVEGYNSVLAISKQKTDQYNAQVGAFNTCLVQFQ